MRNLKKIVAVLLTVALLASMMVSALAASTNTDKALALQAIGLMAGTEADLKLEEGVTRIQGLAFAIRAAGKEADAFAMSDADVAAELAKFTDGATVPGWGQKYAAYAIKNGITVGKGNNLLGALDPISTTSFLVFILKSGMGYSTVTTANVLDVAMEAGVITAAQVVALGGKAALIRDDAALMLFGAAKNGVNADGTTFIQSLIDAGFVTEEAAYEAGFADAPAPEELTVESVEALNLVQVEVKFNMDVDKESAETEGNYKVEGKTVIFAQLQDDGQTVILNLNSAVEQQAKLDISVEDVEDTDENSMDEVEFTDVKFLDTVPPEVVDAEIVGIDTIKVTFSEPVASDVATLKATFSVKDADGDKIYVKADGASGTRYVNASTREAVYVVLSNDLDDEESVTIEVNTDMEDFAGFGVMTNSIELPVVVDEEAPTVVDYKDAKPGEVTLIFDGDITVESSDVDDFYHTNSKSPVDVVPVPSNGNELKLVFDGDSELPEGTAYVYVNKDSVADLWGNKNDQIMIKVEVEVDETAPEATDVDVDSQNTIIVKFSEEITDVSRSDFTVVNSDGDEVSINTARVSGSDSDEVTIVFRDDLSGDYSITIEGIKDLADNKIAKTTLDFTVDDETKPDLDDPDVTVTLYDAGTEEQMIKVYFNEEMAVTGPYSVADVANYAIDDNGDIKDLSDLADVSIDVVDDGKGVEIYIPYDSGDDDIKNNPSLVAGTDELVIARVADAAGNYTVRLSTSRALANGSTLSVSIDKAEMTDTKTIKVTLTDKLVDFDETDLILSGDVDNTDIAKISTTENSDGNTVIVITLEDALLSGGFSINVAVDGTPESETAYGVGLNNADIVNAVADKIAPQLALDSDDNQEAYAYDTNGNQKIDTIVIEYAEALNAAYVNKYTYTVENIGVTNAVVASAVVPGVSVTTGDGVFVVISLNEADSDLDADTAYTPDVTQKFSIYDLANANELKAADADVIETKDAALIVLAGVDYETSVDGLRTTVTWESVSSNGDVAKIVVKDATPNPDTVVATLSATATSYTYVTTSISSFKLYVVDAAGNETEILAH